MTKLDQQLEAHLDHALRIHAFHYLEGFQQEEPTSQICSKEFLLKLNLLLCRVVHNHSDDGKIQILENFLVRTCSLVSETGINIFIRQEAVRKLNVMLERIPRETRRKLIFTEEMMAILSAMGKRILDTGDYDLQVAIIEALCRMTTEAQRVELAHHWFLMEFVSDAFKEIKDADFEADCRNFLNLVNGMLGDRRRVFTFPCLSAHLGNHKLQTPCDEKLEEFWIDFNLESQSLSFYVSSDDEDHQWETVCIPENEVDSYNIEDVGNKMLLTLILNSPAKVNHIKGSHLRIYFDSALDISNVVRKVYGAHRFKGFIKKQSISIAKTTVHVVFDENESQTFIPESQETVSSAKYITVVDTSDVKTKNQLCLTTPSNSQQNEMSSQSSNKLVTPSRTKVSEASINIIVPGTHKTVGPSVTTPSVGKARIKPPLEMMSSAQRKTFAVPSHKDNKKVAANKQSSTAADVESMQTDENVPNLSKESHEEQMDIVPDTQFQVGKKTPILPGLSIKKPARAVHQNKKASVTDVCLSNKDKTVTDLITKFKKNSAFESETSAQKTKPKRTRRTRAKSQPQELCKNTKQGNTKTRQRLTERQNLKNVKKPDASLDTASKEPDIPAHGDDPANNSKKEEQRIKSYNNLTKTKIVVMSKEEMAKSMHEATQSLLAAIGSKYSSDIVHKKQAAALWQNINEHSIQKNKSKGQTKVKLKEKGELNKKRKGEPWEDIYSFQSTEGDNPKIELGVSSNVQPKPAVTTANTKKPGEKKQKSVTGTKQKPKSSHRHLFSDTDTDRGGDDTKTDFSWLKDSASIKKPKIVGYSRQKQTKPPNQTMPCKEEDIPKQTRKRKASCKYGSESSESRKKQVPIEIPQKSENLPKRNKTIQQKPKDSVITSKAIRTSYKMPAMSPISSSPDSIEQVRAEHLDVDTGLPIKNTTFTRLPSSPSPRSSPLANLTPVKSLSISTAVKKVSKHWASAKDKTENKRDVCETVQEMSPVISPTSVASITLDDSTASGFNFLDVQDPDSNEQLVSSSSITDKACLQSRTMTLKKNSCSSYHSSAVVKKTTNVTHTTFHESGPTIRKAMSDVRHISTESSHLADNSTEGSDQGTRHRKIRLLPRRLFPATEEKEPRGSPSTSSGKDESTGDADTWERSDSVVGLMCQNIGKEYTRKIQVRSQKMDYFTEQYMNSAQKHLTSVEEQVRQCRMKHLEKFQQNILEEIENFEKDSKALKQMEKEFTNFCSQQTQVLSVYHNNERKRIHSLKTSFEKNVSHCADFEVKIFTSEMHVMKEDLKNVQELLLKKMNEENLLNVRRGLQSLFMAGTSPF
ncbi:synaptonemal complex protein 2 [Mantella aurantiaca]